MKTIILIALLSIILIVLWYFMIYKPGQMVSNEGKDCMIGGKPGKIRNEICVALPPGAPDSLN